MIKNESRLLKALAIRRKQLLRQKEGLLDTELPQLNLSAGIGVPGSDDDFTNSFKADSPEYSVALEFQYPLGNRSAKADVKKSDLEINELAKEIENVRLDLTDIYISRVYI